MSPLKPAFFELAVRADARWDRFSRGVRRRMGLARPLRILPYRGYGTAERVLIQARVLEDRFVKPSHLRRSLVGSAIASYKRYATVEIPGARVAVHWGDKRWEGTTDDEGFLELWVAPPPGVRPGWNVVELELLEPEPQGVPIVSAQVLVAGPQAELGIISDIDDTVIVTGVTNPLKRAWALFLTEHRTRLPFEGVDAFYSALREGHGGLADNPIFYVSSSPWNLYEHLDEFLALHRIPNGPLLLRDWGLSRHGFAPGGGHGHKLEKIRGVLGTLETLPFILIGDSGQEDAEHYRTIVREYPGRVRCVYIRNVPSRAQRAVELERLAQEVREAGSQLVVVDDTVSAARHAAQAGWIRWQEVPRVQEHQQEDADARTVLDALGRKGS
ncbi:App1 family protein [Hyalangium rubrum]|uniref:Phosphatase domain-containing protein n=1 Tax=Hyalangium rubrum TaxID=3103134 RepID=A0ABU5GZP3_9BACT|nr:phosphatase domain-containing protein [Hyalangium sp. s54d21]MDY7226501.1 phosphatase domain-containing protein [Hyalangium sp. s54d21]